MYELFIPKSLELDLLGEGNEEEKDENVFSDTKLYCLITMVFC